jgi:alkyl sulfatase BDS1-like metallo-beta-lactamase superfamily hydrolase
MDKPRLDQGPDYERGFIDGMMYQTQTTVNKAVDAMSKRTWVGLTKDEVETLSYQAEGNTWKAVELAEAKLKEKNT